MTTATNTAREQIRSQVRFLCTDLDPIAFDEDLDAALEVLRDALRDGAGKVALDAKAYSYTPQDHALTHWIASDGCEIFSTPLVEMVAKFVPAPYWDDLISDDEYIREVFLVGVPARFSETHAQEAYEQLRLYYA